RILTAKQMGLQHLPARVNAPSFAAIEMLKAHAEEIARFEKPLTPAQKLEWFKQVRVTGISTLMTSNRSPTL
ncbi:MAG: hypothetical protein SGJ02_01690, partial [bacterium]|nr:hypothetical protein [bacterium]